MTNEEFVRDLEEMNKAWNQAVYIEKDHEKAQIIQYNMDALCERHARECDMRIRMAHQRMGFSRYPKRW